SCEPCPEGGFQHTPAWPEVTRPPALCRVSAAVGRAKRASRLALTGLVRPSRVSKRPTLEGRSAGLAELVLELAEVGQPALETGVRPEEAAEAECAAALALPATLVLCTLRHRRHEEEGVERFVGAEILGRDAAHLPGDLDQRRCQLGGLADQDCAGPVRCQLAVPRERLERGEPP